MEKKFYTDNFERLLKEKSDEFRMIPSKRVWHSIYNDLHPARRWPSIAMSLLLVAALLFIGYENSGDSKQPLADNNSKQNGGGNKAKIFAQLSPEKNSLTVAVRQNLSVSRNLASDKTGLSELADNTVNKTTTSNQVSNNNKRFLSDADNANGHINQPKPGTGNHSSENQHLKPAFLTDNTPGNFQTQQPAVVALTSEKENNTYKTLTSSLPLVKPLSASEVFATSQIQVDLTVIQSESKNDMLADPATSNMKGQENSGSKKNNNATNSDKKKIQATISTQDKAWVEDYAFHNKTNRKKWKDRLATEIYITPGISYRSLTSNTKYNTSAMTASPQPTQSIAISHSPSLSAEIGGAMVYSFAKNFRIKAGIQFNYTSYNIKAYETNHPVLTTLLLNDLNSGYPYLDSRSTTISNIAGSQQVTLHNKTYQASIPVGLEVKLAGKSNIQWYAGATIQPTYVIGSNAYLPSADNRNYVRDNSFTRKWSLNAGFESFVSVKTNGITFQVGPQLRYQLPSTYGKKFTMDEKLFSAGLKFGVIRNF